MSFHDVIVYTFCFPSLHYTGFEMKGDGGDELCYIEFILIKITVIDIV